MPTPLVSNGVFPRQPIAGSFEVDWADSYVSQTSAKSFYSPVYPSVYRVERHTEEGSPADASETYIVNGSTNMRLVTTLVFPIPNVIAENASSDHPKITTLSVEIIARWPDRGGGGRYNSVIVDVAKLFASSFVSAPSGPVNGFTYRFTVIGVTFLWRYLAQLMTIKVDWTTTSWYEGEASFGFDVDYTVTYLDTEVRLSDVKHLALPKPPDETSGDVDEVSSSMGEWSIAS